MIGDAVCSFNPVYGQGMTVAALEAATLRDAAAPAARCRTRGAGSGPIARVVDAPWQVAVGADLAYPEVAGPAHRADPDGQLLPAPAARRRRPSTRRWALAFVRVLGLLDRPESLLRPDRLLRVARWRGRGRHHPAGADPARPPTRSRARLPGARSAALTRPAPARAVDRGRTAG